MRILKCDPIFDPKEETTTEISWISFPSLPLNFFGEKLCYYSLQQLESFQVDLETQNKTRPSFVRVKVIDLLGVFPRKINVGILKKSKEVI